MQESNGLDPTEIIPIEDLELHRDGINCWCQPFMYEGIIVHNSSDCGKSAVN